VENRRIRSGLTLHQIANARCLRALSRVDCSSTMTRSRIVVASALAAAWLAWRRRARERHTPERVAAAALETLLNAIDANDRQTGAHVRRVAAYALVLARAAGLSEHERRSVERVALFHDVGKIHEALFDIVHDDGRLSPEERALVATHPQRGADVLHPLVTFYPDLSDGVLAHHERWDGSGYPRGLSGEAIPLVARIMSIADSFDAITHRRRYAARRSLADAERAIRAARGTQFDPALVDLFLTPDVLAEIRATFRSTHAPRIIRRSTRPAEMSQRAPDITFRWRSESLAPPPRDLPRRTPPG
jgi:HD-GYP domain-containing protein (c-di-GMP phosphodiesterase class II)